MLLCEAKIWQKKPWSLKLQNPVSDKMRKTSATTVSSLLNIIKREDDPKPTRLHLTVNISTITCNKKGPHNYCQIMLFLYEWVVQINSMLSTSQCFVPVILWGCLSYPTFSLWSAKVTVIMDNDQLLWITVVSVWSPNYLNHWVETISVLLNSLAAWKHNIWKRL